MTIGLSGVLDKSHRRIAGDRSCARGRRSACAASPGPGIDTCGHAATGHPSSAPTTGGASSPRRKRSDRAADHKTRRSYHAYVGSQTHRRAYQSPLSCLQWSAASVSSRNGHLNEQVQHRVFLWESLRRLPWCTCVSASARQSRAQCRARELCCKILMLKPCTAHTLSLAHDRRCWEFCGSFSAVGRQSSRVSALFWPSWLLQELYLAICEHLGPIYTRGATHTSLSRTACRLSDMGRRTDRAARPSSRAASRRASSATAPHRAAA